MVPGVCLAAARLEPTEVGAAPDDRRDPLRDSGQFAKCEPHQVTFYKRLATSSGRVRNVEVAKVYLSPAIKKDDTVPAALARFEQDRGARLLGAGSRRL